MARWPPHPDDVAAGGAARVEAVLRWGRAAGALVAFASAVEASVTPPSLLALPFEGCSVAR